MLRDSSQTLRDFEILRNVTVYFFFSFRIISFLLRSYFFSPADQQQCDREFFLPSDSLNEEKRNLRLLYFLLVRFSVVIFCVSCFQFIANKCFHLFWRLCIHRNSQTYYERFIFSSWAIEIFSRIFFLLQGISLKARNYRINLKCEILFVGKYLYRNNIDNNNCNNVEGP